MGARWGRGSAEPRKDGREPLEQPLDDNELRGLSAGVAKPEGCRPLTGFVRCDSCGQWYRATALHPYCPWCHEE